MLGPTIGHDGKALCPIRIGRDDPDIDPLEDHLLVQAMDGGWRTRIRSRRRIAADHMENTHHLLLLASKLRPARPARVMGPRTGRLA